MGWGSATKQGTKEVVACSWGGCLHGAGALLRPRNVLHNAVDMSTAASPGGLTACRARDGVAHGGPFWRVHPYCDTYLGGYASTRGGMREGVGRSRSVDGSGLAGSNARLCWRPHKAFDGRQSANAVVPHGLMLHVRACCDAIVREFLRTRAVTSHFHSQTQAGPDGSGPAVASIGDNGFGGIHDGCPREGQTNLSRWVYTRRRRTFAWTTCRSVWRLALCRLKRLVHVAPKGMNSVRTRDTIDRRRLARDRATKSQGRTRS